MNITEVLSLLKEDWEINKFNEIIKDKVDPNAIRPLSSLMKKGKYDGIAVEMLKAMQKLPPEKKEFLEKHASLVYAIFNEAKKGNSSFNPGLILSHYAESKDDPKTFWKDYRIKIKNPVIEKKTPLGLSNAKKVVLRHNILYFPRTFKKTGNFGLSVDDVNKQWEDLKKLSWDMAKLDDSGEVQGDKKANENHWCVAKTDDNSFYNHYKEEGDEGLFIVIVGKKPDGNPDFTKRYLLWTKGPKGPNNREFADKFDNHVDIEDALPYSTRYFIFNNIEKNFQGVGQRKLAEKIEGEVNKRIRDDREKFKEKDSIEQKNLKKIINFIKGEYNKNASPFILKGKGCFDKNLKSLAEEIKKNGGIFEFFNEKGEHRKDEEYYSLKRVRFDRESNDKDGLIVDFWLEKGFDGYLFTVEICDLNEDSFVRYALRSDSLKGLEKTIIKAAEGSQPNRERFELDGTSDDAYRKVANISFDKWKKLVNDFNKGDVYKNTQKHFRDNKEIMKAYDKTRGDGFMGTLRLSPYFNIRKDYNIKRYVVKFVPNLNIDAKVIGYLDEPDILSKVKKAYDTIPEGKKFDKGSIWET